VEFITLIFPTGKGAVLLLKGEGTGGMYSGSSKLAIIKHVYKTKRKRIKAKVRCAHYHFI
jgi:hypothetical protein